MSIVTETFLRAQVARVNVLTNSPCVPYSPDGKPEVGNFHLDFAYGGVSLHRMCQGGGETDVFNRGYMSKRELSDLLAAFILGWQLGYEQGRGQS